MPSHNFDKANFDRTANDKTLWRMRAVDLHLASQVLRNKVLEHNDTSFELSEDTQKKLESGESFESPELGRMFACLTDSGLVFQAAMLQGFTIEVYLKAYWLHTGHKLAEDGEYGIDTLKRDNHNLSAIADAVSFSISAIEREVLGRLSLFVSSYGRYPITKKWHQNSMKENEHGILTRLSWNNSDHEIAEQLIGRLSPATNA